MNISPISNKQAVFSNKKVSDNFKTPSLQNDSVSFTGIGNKKVSVAAGLITAVLTIFSVPFFAKDNDAKQPESKPVVIETQAAESEKDNDFVIEVIEVLAVEDENNDVAIPDDFKNSENVQEMQELAAEEEFLKEEESNLKASDVQVSQEKIQKATEETTTEEQPVLIVFDNESEIPVSTENVENETKAVVVSEEDNVSPKKEIPKIKYPKIGSEDLDEEYVASHNLGNILLDTVKENSEKELSDSEKAEVVLKVAEKFEKSSEENGENAKDLKAKTEKSWKKYYSKDKKSKDELNKIKADIKQVSLYEYYSKDEKELAGKLTEFAESDDIGEKWDNMLLQLGINPTPEFPTPAPTPSLPKPVPMCIDFPEDLDASLFDEVLVRYSESLGAETPEELLVKAQELKEQSQEKAQKAEELQKEFEEAWDKYSKDPENEEVSYEELQKMCDNAHGTKRVAEREEKIANALIECAQQGKMPEKFPAVDCEENTENIEEIQEPGEDA